MIQDAIVTASRLTSGQRPLLEISLSIGSWDGKTNLGPGQPVVILSRQEYETLVGLQPAPADNNKTLHLKGLEQIDENASDAWL